LLCHRFQEQGVKYRVLIQNERDLSRQVVKSDYATITVPEIELEIPPNTHRGGTVVNLSYLIVDLGDDDLSRFCMRNTQLFILANLPPKQ
jgi:C4-type Zn-finger protein